MGLREKVTITLVIIALTQIACRHCMPRTPRKDSLKRYLNDLKPVKNNPVSSLYSPSKLNKTPKQTFGKTAKNGRNSQNSLPKKSLYKKYNFPENEYPLDNAPRDPFRIGMNFNENNNVNTLQKARNLQSSAINDLKKERKMKRKLLSNKQVNNENIPLKTDMSSIKIASNPDSVRLLDSETFPEVQYPLNTMETWGQNYWHYLPFTQEQQFNGLGQQAFDPKAREGVNQPFTRLTKAKASKFLQSYDKLKEEHRRTSTENSKRSSVGQKGLNYTKTATCERVSDDFITAGLLSNNIVNPSDSKTLEANIEENTCSLTENPYHTMPLPYKVIGENIENVCPAFEMKNNTQKLEDVDSSVIAKTLQLIEEILLNDDTSSKVPSKNKSKEKENNVKTTEIDYTSGSANKDIPINPIDNAETSTVVHVEELSQEISEDAQADILQYNLPSLPEETTPENTTIVAGPLNVRMPLPFTEPITYGALTNASSPDLTYTTTLSNVGTVPGYTSIIIIPMNNDAVGKSHMFDTTSDTPIIVYLPSTQSSSIPSQTPPLNNIVSSSLGNPVTNNQLYNVLSNMAPVQNDNPSSTALVSELLNSISDSGSSLPIHETLPTNSKCYNNENSPSSMREKPVSDNLIHKSLIDDAPFVTPSCDEKLCQQPVETENSGIDSETLPPTLDFEHPVFDFADSDITSLSHGPYNNVLNNELSIIAREIHSDQQINDTSSKDLFIATQNITTEHKTNSLDSVSDDSLSESPNGVPTAALDKDLSSETPSYSLEILKNPSDSLSNLPVSTNKSIFPSQMSKQISESPQSIHEMPPTLPDDTPTVELPPPKKASLTPTRLSETFFDKLPEIMDTKVPPTIVSDITSDSVPQPIHNTPVPSPILNSTPMTTDLTLKTELYKIRQILDRMLSSESRTDTQPPPLDKVLSPISDTDSLPLLENQSLSPIQTPTDTQPPPLDKVLSPISDTDSLPLLENQSLSPIQTPTDTQPPPLGKVLSPISDTDSLPLLESQSLSPIQTPTDSQPPPLDKVLSPISDTDSLPQNQSLSTIQIPTDSQPPPLDDLLSPIQRPSDSQSPPLDKVLSPISDTTSLPLLENQLLSPVQTPTDSQPAPVHKVLSPIQTPTYGQPAPVDKVLSPIQTPPDGQPPPLYEALSPIQTPIDRQPPPLGNLLSPIQMPTYGQPPPLDKQLSSIQTPTDSQPPPLVKVLSPISDTNSLPLIENQSSSPIQTLTDSQPAPVDKVLSPISDTDSLPLLEHQSLSPIQTTTDSQPPPLGNILSPIQTPTYGQPPPLNKVLPPISDTNSLPLIENQSASPIQTPTDSQPAPVDKVLSPVQTPTDSQPAPVDKVLSPVQTPTDSQPAPVDKVLSPVQTPTDSQPAPVDKVLSPVQTPTDSQPAPVDKVLSPIQTPTDRQPPPLDKVLSPISDTDSLPLLEHESLSPIQTTTDSQPPPLGNILSPIQTPTYGQPPPLNKVLLPISDTNSLPLIENQSSSPIQTPIDRQPPPLDKVFSPIQTLTDSQPAPVDKVFSPVQMPINRQPPSSEKVLSPIQTPIDRQPPPLDKVLSPIQTPTDRHLAPVDKVLSPIQTPTDSHLAPVDKVLSPIQTPTDSHLAPVDKVLSPIQTPTDSHLAPVDKVLSPIQTPTDRHLAPVDKVLSPIQTPTDRHLAPVDKVLSPIQTATGSQPALVDKVLSPIQKPTDRQSPPLDNVLSPIQTPFDRQPPPLDKVFSPIQTLTDSQPAPVDKVLSPIQTPTDRQSPPLDKVLSPISDTDSLPLLEHQSLSPMQTPTDGQPSPLDKQLSAIQTPTNSQPPPLVKVLSPISDTDSLPLLENQSLSPIQTPTNSQPAPVDKVLSPISDTDSLPLLENQSLSPIQTPTNSQPAPVDKVLSPIQTPTARQSPPLDKVLSPIQTPTNSQPAPVDKVLSPVQTPTDRQSPPLDKVLSPIQTPTDSQPAPVDKVLSLIQTPTCRQPPPLDKVLSPIQTPTDRQSPPLDKVLSPIQTSIDRQSPPLDKVLSPIQTSIDRQPPLLDKVFSPIQTLTDSQPAPVDKVLSPIQTPTDRQPPPLDKVLSPISDTESLPLLENQSLSPIHTITYSQPAPVDKVLSPIQTPTGRHPAPVDKVLSPVQTPTDRQSPPLDKFLSHIQTPTDSQPAPVDKVLSPIQTPTDRQPPPLDEVLSPISDTDSLPLLENQSLSPIHTITYSQPAPVDKVLSPIQTPFDRQSLSLDKVLSPISGTDSLPLLENQSLSFMQTLTDHQPPPLDKVLSPIQMPTDRQSPPLGDVLSPISDTDSLPLFEEQSLSPIQTPTDSQPSPLDKILPPKSDTDSLPLLENQSLSPTQTPTDSVPQFAGDKTLLPLPVTDSPIDSLQLQDHETLLKTPIYGGFNDNLPSLMDKSHLSKSVLESTESLPQALDEIVPPTPLFETTIDNKPYLVNNLVTPLYEAVTSRNKDITKNELPHKIDDLTFNMEFPDIYEVCNDDHPLYVDDLPIKAHQENSESPLWMIDLPMDVVETPNLLSETLVSDLIKPTEVLTLPMEGELEIASLGFHSHTDMLLLSDSMDNDHQHFPPSKDASDGLPALPMDEFKSVQEVIPNSQSHEISYEFQPQKYDLPLPVDKLIPDIFLSDALSNEPFVIDDSPSPVTDKIPEIQNSTANTKDPPLIDNRLLSPEDDASPDTLGTDIPTAVLPSLNEALQSTYLDKTSDEVLSKPTLSDFHRDNLPLPIDKTLPLSDNTLTNLLPSNKTLSSTELLITKALLENVLSDINKGALSSQVAKALPVTPASGKTVYYVDEKSPLYESKEIPLLPVENSFPNAEDNDNLIENLLVSQITEDTPTKDLPVEFQLPMDKMSNDNLEISTDDAGGDNANGTQTSNNLSGDQPLPNEKISPLTDILLDISRNEKSSSSNLLRTKALLENVLSEINTKGFSIPVSKAVSATSSSVLDKTHYYIDSRHSEFAEDSSPLPEDKILPNTAHTDNNLPFSAQTEDTLSLEENKTLSEIQSIDISTKISSPMDEIVPNDDLPSSVTEIISFPKDTPSDSQLPNNKNNSLSSSTIPLAKALLENVLSDINTKGFSLPAAKALPVASRTQLDKTLYFLESPRPDTTVESSVSDDPIENDHYSEINEDVLPPSADKVVADNQIIDIPTDDLISGKMFEDNSDDLTEEVEDSDETLFSEELADEFLSEMEKPLSLDNMPDDLSVPPTKHLFFSVVPITKALLKKVFSDITDGAIAAKDLFNHPNL